jgi:cold shock CspA family protein
MTDTLKGTVVRLLPDKGFGFLAGPDGTEYFFHRSAAPLDFDALSVGCLVTFVPTEGPKGPRAERVTAK